MRRFTLSERDIWPGCREIAVEGELDLSVVPEFEAALARALAEEQHVLVELTECEFVDVSAVRALVEAHDRLESRQRQLLVNGATGQARRVLAATDLAGIWTAPARRAGMASSLSG